MPPTGSSASAFHHLGLCTPWFWSVCVCKGGGSIVWAASWVLSGRLDVKSPIDALAWPRFQSAAAAQPLSKLNFSFSNSKLSSDNFHSWRYPPLELDQWDWHIMSEMLTDWFVFQARTPLGPGLPRLEVTTVQVMPSVGYRRQHLHTDTSISCLTAGCMARMGMGAASAWLCLWAERTRVD